jgi:hypothetical protein
MMKYRDFSKIYTYGLFLGSIITTVIFLVLFFLGLDKKFQIYELVLAWGVIVILFVIGA